MRMRRKKMGGSRVGSEPVIYQGSGFFPGLVAAGICADAAAVFGTGLRKGRICFSIRPCQSGKNLLAVDISSNMLGVARRKIDAAFSQAGKRRAMCGWQPMTLSALEKFCQNRIR